MPPVNTPRTTSPERLMSDAQHLSDHTYLRSSTPMSYLSAPVPDYAASLYTHATDAADEANTAFLRNSLDSPSTAQPTRTSTIDHTRDPRLLSSRRQDVTGDPGTADNPGNRDSADTAEIAETADNPDIRGGSDNPDIRGSSDNPDIRGNSDNPDTPENHRSTSPTQRDRLQRYLSHLYRMHHPPAPVAAAYSNRTPSPTRQSIYDWAPGTYEEVNTEQQTAGRQQPRHAWRQQSNAEPAQEVPALSSQRHQQGVPPNATERMLRYFMDRERSGLSEEEERARGTGWYRPTPDRGINTENWHTSVRDETWNRSTSSRQERVDAFRREYLSGHMPSQSTNRDRSSNTTKGSTLVENALHYLDGLRHCDCYDDALAAAIDHDLTTKDLFASKHDEFILDLYELDTLHETSWLQPGAVFEGRQYASTATPPRARHQPASATSVEQINPHYRSQAVNNNHSSSSTQFTAYRGPHTSWSNSASRSHNTTNSSPDLARMATCSLDHWPVRMIIHAIDFEEMTLQGTMEAYDVPQHPLSLERLRNNMRTKAGKKEAPITTYVEGHIIDLHINSFLTPDIRPAHKDNNDHNILGTSQRRDAAIFPSATPTRDAENWRKLPPFSDLSEDEMAEMLLSKDRLDALNNDYIFMRWKERCFVHGKDDTCSHSDRRSDHDRGHGLTISGFYYISLRRSDGTIEGLYYDPHSTPFQHLRLTGTKATWPAWQFR